VIYFLNALWLLTSIFLILVVLIRGGGLAGAFGGAGGSSAFGTRAGDVMTKITVGIFVAWIVLCLVLIWLMTPTPIYTGGSEAGKSIEAPKDGASQPFGDGKGAEIPSPTPVEKPAGAAAEEKKDAAAKPADQKEAAPKSEGKPAAAKEAPKSAPAEKAPADSKAQPTPKAEQPATNKAEPATKKQG
jgi:preprotein translocase subunit SecG